MSSLSEQPAPTPKLMDFATDLAMSWKPGYEHGMWRTEIDDLRNGLPVHIVSEAQCPDRFRVVVTGAEQSEKIYIGNMLYERIGHKPWSSQKMKGPHEILKACGRSVPPTYDAARIRLIADQFNNVEVDGPITRDVNGTECREWTRTIPQFGKTLQLSTCYDLKTRAVVQSKYGEQVQTFFWNAKVDIRPPM